MPIPGFGILLKKRDLHVTKNEALSLSQLNCYLKAI